MTLISQVLSQQARPGFLDRIRCLRFFDDTTVVLGVVIVFTCLGFVNIVLHEMWRDELQAWTTVCHSASLAELFQHLRYSGHPSLWYLGLYGFSKVTHHPFAMQAFHVGVASLAAAVFLYRSPFRIEEKILFTFGYFLFFEYLTISRNYSLGVLLLFVFCALFPFRQKHYLLLSCLLILLAQTNIHGLILSICLGLVVFGEYVLKRMQSVFAVVQVHQVVGGVSLWCCGLLVSIIQLIPPPDSGYAVGWITHFDYARLLGVLSGIWKSYVPLPQLHYQFWNTNVIESVSVQAAFSLLLFVFFSLLLVRKPLAFLLYIAGTGGILLFSYAKFPGALRHYGHLFLWLAVCLWLATVCVEKQNSSLFLNKLSGYCMQVRRPVWLAILVCQCVAGFLANGIDWLYSFSASKAAARFIRDHGLDNLLLVGDRDTVASAVAGHLGTTMYYPKGDRFGSFIIWDEKRVPHVSPETVVKKASELSSRNARDVLLILNYRLPETVVQSATREVMRVQELKECIVHDECYYLYQMKYGGADG
jgi:hypothetical protein